MNRFQLAATAVAGALFLLVSAVGCGSAEPTLPAQAAPVAVASTPTTAATTAPTTAPTAAPTTAPVTAVVEPVAVEAAAVAPAPRRVPATTRAAAPKPVQAALAAPKPAPKPAAKPAPKPAPKPKPAASSASGCNSNYTPCVPNDPKDVDCQGGSGNGPSYVKGPVTVTGTDVYGLDADKDGIGCE